MKVAFVIEPFKVELLGIAYLASALKKEGIEVELIKVDKMPLTDEFFKELKIMNPSVLAYSVATGKHKKFLEINRQIQKRVRIVSIFGGSHPTYYPDLINEKGVDFIVRGEAEKSFVKLLTKMRLKKTVKRIVGFTTLEEKVDRIALPDREFLYKYPENRNNPIKNVMTSRGCRFKCPYCLNSLYRSFYAGQKWVRFRSAENVLVECASLKRYPLELIYFQDDEFLTNPHLEELLSLYKVRVNVPFHCQIRIELLNEKNVVMLKEAGCHGVTFAAESGDEKVRKELLQRPVSNVKIVEGANLLRKYGLSFRVENMVGLPTETLNQMFETVKLNRKLKAVYNWCSIFQPYPNLPLANFALDKDLWSGSLNDVKETFFEDTVLKTTIPNEISNLQRLFAFAIFFKIPEWVLRLMIKVRSNNRLYNKIHVWFKAWRFKTLYDV